MESVVFTLQIRALFLPEACTRFLHSCRKGYLDILRHDLVPPAHTPILLRITHHRLNPLNAPLTLMKPARDLLRQPLNNPLLFLAHILISKPRQYMLLMQLVQLRRLLRDLT